MLPEWAWNQVLGGCNKFQRTLGEFIAFHWVQLNVWSTSIGRRFGSRSCSSPRRYGSWGDHTHGRSKSCWPGPREIRFTSCIFPVHQFRGCLAYHLTRQRNTLTLNENFDSLLAFSQLGEMWMSMCVTPSNVQFQYKMTCWSQFQPFWIKRLLQGTHLKPYCCRSWS
jgi:hypothetical protein